MSDSRWKDCWAQNSGERKGLLLWKTLWPLSLKSLISYLQTSLPSLIWSDQGSPSQKETVTHEEKRCAYIRAWQWFATCYCTGAHSINVGHLVMILCRSTVEYSVYFDQRPLTFVKSLYFLRGEIIQSLDLTPCQQQMALKNCKERSVKVPNGKWFWIPYSAWCASVQAMPFIDAVSQNNI